MIARRESHTHILSAMFNKLTDWATLGDYDRAKDAATDKIIRRQARGNVSVQNGWYMTDEQLQKRSRKADTALASLRRSMPN